MFKTTFSGYNKIWKGKENLGGRCPRMTAVTTGLIVPRFFKRKVTKFLHYLSFPVLKYFSNCFQCYSFESTTIL